MALIPKSRILAFWIMLGLSGLQAGCSSMIDELEKEPAPDIAKAVAGIKNVAGEYHLTGQLEIAGPIDAPIASLTPWVICLRSSAETRFKVALSYKGDTYVSAREATMADRCDNQAYQPLPK
jgi:hypothetical protein